jgi:hypothetical protein
MKSMKDMKFGRLVEKKVLLCYPEWWWEFEPIEIPRARLTIDKNMSFSVVAKSGDF